ncbi:hypothetical protein LG202_10730 [Methylobacillus methanolivorans]
MADADFTPSRLISNRERKAKWRKDYLAARSESVLTWNDHRHKVRCCVLFVKNGKEHRTPWFNYTTAKVAHQLMANKYGAAAIYLD